MHDNDKTMNSMKHNGKPLIDDEVDAHVKSIELFANNVRSPVQSGDSGSWKRDEHSGDDSGGIIGDSFYIRQNSAKFESNGKQGASLKQIRNGNYKKEPTEPHNSTHSKTNTTDPNGNCHLKTRLPSDEDSIEEVTPYINYKHKVELKKQESPESAPVASEPNSSNHSKYPTQYDLYSSLMSPDVEQFSSPLGSDEPPETDTGDWLSRLVRTAQANSSKMSSEKPDGRVVENRLSVAPDYVSRDFYIPAKKAKLENTYDNEAQKIEPGNLRLNEAQTRQLVDVGNSNMQALRNQRRAAEIIRRLISIRTRLMNPSTSRVEAKKQKIRNRREKRHVTMMTLAERAELFKDVDDGYETPETDESDIEEIGFLNDKIGFEQRKIRLREKLEEEKSRRIETRRTWLLRQIQNCDKKYKTISERLSKYQETGQNHVDEIYDGHCARTRIYNGRKPKKVHRVTKDIILAMTTFEKVSQVRQLDNSYHHILSTARSIPLSTRLTTVLHDFDPAERLEVKKQEKGRNERRDKRFSDRKKQKQRNENLLNHIVVPPSSYITSIEMPKYKNIDTPGYRSDETSDPQKEEDDEDISHESYVRRHIIAEKQEKLRYYQSAIQKSRKRKKQQLDPRLASPKATSYIISDDTDPGYGYKKIQYPIPSSSIGEYGYREIPKKKKQKKQWRSSTTEGSGGLRLKLSLRKT